MGEKAVGVRKLLESKKGLLKNKLSKVRLGARADVGKLAQKEKKLVSKIKKIHVSDRTKGLRKGIGKARPTITTDIGKIVSREKRLASKIKKVHMPVLKMKGIEDRIKGGIKKRKEEIRKEVLSGVMEKKKISEKKRMRPVKFRGLKKEERAIFSAEEIKQLDLRLVSDIVKKRKTGIDGLDMLFTKGVPVGASVLVEGGPGSGKTIFCLQLAHCVCRKGGKALYMSFEEPETRLLNHMKNFGWEPEKYIRNGQLLVKRYSALDISRSVEALLSAAKKELLIEVRPVFFPKGFEPDIVLIDSLTSISSAFSGEASRFRIYMEQLFKYLEDEHISSFLIRETPVPTHIGKGIGRREEAVSFLSDGIIALYNVILPSGDRTGGLEVIKMRGEKFKKTIVHMEITSNGIVVHPDKKIDIKNIIT